MLVRIVNIRKESCSCNFCKEGKLNGNQNGLIYPYEYVYEITRESGGGITAFICEKCFDLLVKEVEFIKNSTI